MSGGSPLLRHAGPPGPEGITVRIDPATEPTDLGGVAWRWIWFSSHKLTSGESLSRPADDREVAVIILEGGAHIAADGITEHEVAGRASVFDASPPPVMLVEPGRGVTVTAVSSAAVAIAAAPGGEVRSTRLIDPARVRIEARGQGQTLRTVRHLLPADEEAGRLILVEVITPGGNWSSYPPHKHDTDDPPRECLLEELYLYRFRRPGGFAFQRVYTADRSLDEAVTPGDGDVVLVPRGYHAVGVPAGYDCYYLNVMAGPVRSWRFTLDPDHAWLMDWDPDAPRS